MSPSIQLTIVAPQGRVCGIGDYAGFLANALENEFVLSWIDPPPGPSAGDWLRAAAQADCADVVHVHFEPSLFSIPRPYINRFATFMKRLRPPAMVTLHDAIPQLRPRFVEKRPYAFTDLVRDLAYVPFYLPWEKIQYQRAQHWLVHSPSLRDRLGQLVGHERVSLALHPIPPAERVWSPAKAYSFDLISLGFVKAHKGYLKMLDVLSRLPHLTWVVAGGPQDHYDRIFADRLMSAVKRCGLQDRVIMTGYLNRRDLEQLAVKCKAAVFPFEWAAGSGSLTWAIALGLPVLATDLPALVQYREAGAGVELLPLNHCGSWPGLIDSLLQDMASMTVLSNANRQFAHNHSYGALADIVIPLYRRLAQAGRPS